jgi:hypothetical protein
MQPQRKSIITDEGEIRDVSNTQREPATYCPQCGTSNRIDSHFCRNCGTALDDNEIPVSRPVEKSKHAVSQHVQTGPNIFTMAIEVVTLVMVGAMCLAALIVNSGSSAWLIIPILTGWFMVVGARNGIFK